MAILKCKMCGGDLTLTDGASVAECEYCGTTQTVPTLDNEKKLNLFARANRLRAACEFDKAAGVYESIVSEFDEEAEAYWGLILCKYGIEYVDDPATGKKIPTCHRSSFECVLDDHNFELVMENADGMARRVYREEAKTIEELRKGIVEVSSKEEPYDIFICYKETAFDGQRTLDSVLAQDIYDTLTEKGYRVFFSRVTLEDKLGQEYEPYIFAALQSAKVMLAVGTDYEHYNAVWVKNEWSRFLQLMASGQKKHLIPCFKGIDAYDMPKEFARLQAQDLGKIGAMQDLLRGIEKLLPRQGETVKETVVVQQAAVTAANPTTESYLKRAFIFLEDGNWNAADEYCEKVLDIDPENARAYLGKLMAELQARQQEDLSEQENLFDNSINYQKAIRFGDETLKAVLVGLIEKIKIRNKHNYLESTYTRASHIMTTAKTEESFKNAAQMFHSLEKYKDSEKKAMRCAELAEIVRKDALLSDAKSKMIIEAAKPNETSKSIAVYTAILQQLELIPSWKDADENAAFCRKQLEKLRTEETKQKEYDRILGSAKNALLQKPDIQACEMILQQLKPISGWRDANEVTKNCLQRIEELNAMRQRWDERRRQSELAMENRRINRQKDEWRTAGLCQYCGGELKGFFSKKCTVCGKPKDY